MAWQKIGKTQRTLIANNDIGGAPTATFLLDVNNYAWGWGQNNTGALGTNNSISRSSPVSVVGGRQWLSISGGYNYLFCAGIERTKSYAWAWGQNTYGQVGINNIIQQSSPSSVLGGRQWKAIACGGAHAVAIDLSGYLWAWGYNNVGQLGDGTIISKSSPVSVLGGRLWSALPPGFGGSQTIALDINGYAWAWGDGAYGNLAQYINIINYSSPASVVGGKQFFTLATCVAGNCVALDLSSYAWGWGRNAYGQLGDGTTLDKSSPTSAIGGRQFTSLHKGTPNQTSYGIDANGSVWAWGDNGNGQYGVNTIVSKSSPTNTGNKFSKIYGGIPFAVGIDALGYAWSWGGNGTYGLLGQNTNVNSSTPAYVWKFSRTKNILGRGIN